MLFAFILERSVDAGFAYEDIGEAVGIAAEFVARVRDRNIAEKSGSKIGIGLRLVEFQEIGAKGQGSEAIAIGSCLLQNDVQVAGRLGVDPWRRRRGERGQDRDKDENEGFRA
ncbi:MAG: hypothetical protein NTW86_15520 [Candidatus Sumerlaeota bacterium]|nr:hypothetical protein [Candidatus Sumerlaeota bacterium]